MERSNLFYAAVACAIVFAVVVDAYPCAAVSCQSNGGYCISNYSHSVHCTGGTTCLTGSTNLCAYGYSNGQTCVYPTDCASSVCNTITGTCAAYITGPGGACSSNSECTFTNSTSTIALCQSGACFGIPHGGACDTVGSVTECVGTDYCNSNNVCATKISPGGACSSTGDQCTDMSYCSSGVCVTLGSVAEGSLCSSTAQCEDNDYCGSGRCTPAVSAGGNTCDVNTDCQASTCQCNAVLGYERCTVAAANPTGYSSRVVALAKCIASSGCPDEQCYRSRCNSQYCAYHSFEIGASRTESLLTEPDCLVNDVVSLQQKALNAYCSGAQKVTFGVLASVVSVAALILL